MQGARRAHIHWPIFNRRATPQDGTHWLPNADLFVGQDTMSGSGSTVYGYVPC
jgi:hypothetical protein